MVDNIRYRPLPDTLFLVRVPMIATYSDHEISTVGMPVNMINGVADMRTFNSMVTCMLPLDRIIDIYVSGYPIRLVNHSDLETIYNMLDTYVRGTSDPTGFNLNADRIVEDRLFEIERFASEIFDTNKVAILKQAMRFEHGYTADIEPMGMAMREDKHVVNHIENNYMDSYKTVLSGDPYGLNSGSGNVEVRVPKDFDKFRTNPGKKELSNYTYTNNNLPDIDFDRITRDRTIIRLK